MGEWANEWMVEKIQLTQLIADLAVREELDDFFKGKDVKQS